MPHTAREISSTGEYHVMMRGINHQKIFDGPNDAQNFLKIIFDLKQRPEAGNRDSDWFVMAYALMGNHLHLLIKVGDVKIGEVIKKFHQNPVKAGLVDDVADYEFTSWHEFVNDGKNKYAICNRKYVLKRIDIDCLRELVYTPLSESTTCLDIEKIPEVKLTDEEVREWFYKRTGVNIGHSLASMEKDTKCELIVELRSIGCGIRHLSRMSGISLSTLVKYSKTN